MIGEFGGIGAFIAGKEWVPQRCHTYLHVDNATAEADAYVGMAATILKYQKVRSNFDKFLFLDHFSRISHGFLSSTPPHTHAPCAVLSLMPVLLGY